MTAIQFDPLVDLEVCEAMVEEFDDYLSSAVLYWQMNPAKPSSHAWPRLTIGGGLERLCRLRAYKNELTPEQRARLERAQNKLEAMRGARAVRYQTKAARELQSRLDAWEWFLDDYTNRPQEVAAYYPSEVRARLKIALLIDALQGVPELEDKLGRLQALDERLRADFVPGEFVWHPTLAAAFPPDQYWWLYGGVKEARQSE